MIRACMTHKGSVEEPLQQYYHQTVVHFSSFQPTLLSTNGCLNNKKKRGKSVPFILGVG